MGPKITIDSATLMNKGLEVIEAHYLFDLEYSSIHVLIHPEGVVHAMAEFRDGSLRAEMATADMRLPIQLAHGVARTTRPPGSNRCRSPRRPLTFEPVDREAFPAVDLAYRVGGLGLTFPAVMNAANEVAVMAFLEGKIALTRIVEIVQTVVDEHEPASVVSIVNIERADGWARRASRRDHRGTLARKDFPRMNLLVGMLIFLPFITIIISLHEFGALLHRPEVRHEDPRVLRGVRSADSGRPGAARPSTASSGCCWVAT